MALLLEEAQRLMAQRDPSALLRLVCAAARRLTLASIVGLGTVSDGEAVDDFVAVGLDDETIAQLRTSLSSHDDHPAHSVLTTRKVVSGVNPGGDPTAIGLPVSHPPVHSYLFVPVASPSRIYGWLALVEKEGVQAFSDEDEQLASTLGALAGMAYENARLVGDITDITERRSLEHQLRQSQKMEALGQLAGGVAHDFNNLLTAIVGYGRFALELATNAAQRHDIEEIVKAAGRAAALTKQLLAFSRRHMVETAVLDLNLLIVDMVTMLRRMIGEDIELATTLAAGLSFVRADRSQLEQVVMNLVINARDACGPGGRIRLVTKAVDVDGTTAARAPGLARGAYVTLSVVDNGSGMNEATKSRLFEPFFTTKPRGQGTGLGLATVYGIVVQSGGAIQVESEFGQGSTFTVYLPREKEATHAVERPVDAQVASSRRTVLLVEDEQAVRELVRIILERAGHHVVEAADPEAAIVQFNKMESVDLLLTDVVMPAMTGFDLFHELVARLPSLRVLFISGYTDYALFEPTIADKGAAFLEKPFSAEALIGKVREVLS